MSHRDVCITLSLILLIYPKRGFAACNRPFAITIRPARGSVQVCGGVLLHARWALTAAHCVYGIETPSSIAVVAKLTKFKKIIVEQIFICDLFDPKTLENDYGLLFVWTDFPKMTFAVLCSKALFLHLLKKEQRDLQVVTWEENNPAVKKKRFMVEKCRHVDVLAFEHCKFFFATTLNPEVMFCTTSDRNGQTPCRGDSGSPVLYGRVVLGAVSFGDGCKRLRRPSVYSRIDQALDFVNSSVKTLGYDLATTTLPKEKHPVYYISAGSAPAGETPKLVIILPLSFVLLK